MNQPVLHQKTVLDIARFIADNHPEVGAYFVENRRQLLADLICKTHNNAVAHGPLKGMRLHQSAHWGRTDKAAMILGIYEEEVLSDLAMQKGRYKTFIDLGAADGFYGVGVLVGGLFERSYCFEIAEAGQRIIQETAALNQVSNRVRVFGEAKPDFASLIAPEDLADAVLFVDIEGAEFDLFSPRVFEDFRRSRIYIELHDWFFPDAANRVEKLKNESKLTHRWSEVSTSARDPSRFPELSNLCDTDRWLICSEGRGRLMRWAILDPI